MQERTAQQVLGVNATLAHQDAKRFHVIFNNNVYTCAPTPNDQLPTLMNFIDTIANNAPIYMYIDLAKGLQNKFIKIKHGRVTSNSDLYDLNGDAILPFQPIENMHYLDVER